MSSSGCARPDKSNETAVPIVSIPKFNEGKESWKSESNSSPVSVASGVECLMESPLPSQVSMDDWMELLHLLNHDECLKLEEKMEESLFMPIDKLE